jgi:hypothetical protein
LENLVKGASRLESARAPATQARWSAIRHNNAGSCRLRRPARDRLWSQD